MYLCKHLFWRFPACLQIGLCTICGKKIHYASSDKYNMQNAVIIKIDEIEAKKRPVNLINLSLRIISESNTFKRVSSM